MYVPVKYCMVLALILACILASGCIVPTKETPSSKSQNGGTNYLVAGSGAGPSPQATQGGEPGAPVAATATPMPDDTRFLTQVPTYSAGTDTGPAYRNLSYQVDPTPTTPNYQNIYNNELSLKDYTVAYTYDLKTPPLVINFDIKPKMDTRTIWYEDRFGSYDSNGRRGDVYVTADQLSPNAWFSVVVRDRDTGTIVLEDGYGRTYGGVTNRTVSVRSSGNYQIDMSGNEVNVTVRMYIIP